MSKSTTHAPHAGSSNTVEKQRSHYTTAHSQRLQILEHLQRGNSLTTQQSRLELDILSPAPRVFELRKMGHKIITYWDIYEGGKGEHRIARYVLLAGGAYE